MVLWRFVKIFRFPSWFRLSIPFKKRVSSLRKRLGRGFDGTRNRSQRQQQPNGLIKQAKSKPSKNSVHEGDTKHAETSTNPAEDAQATTSKSDSFDNLNSNSFKIPKTTIVDEGSEHFLNDPAEKIQPEFNNKNSGRFRVSAGRSFKFLLDRRSRKWIIIRSKKWSIASTASMWSFGDDSSATSSAPPVTSPRETIIIHDEELFMKLENVMSDRRMRDRLVQELLSEHSPSARLVRFLTAINELLGTLDRKDWRRKSSKIISLFVNKNARYHVEIPVEFLPNLIRKRRVGFVDIRRHFLNELTLDSHVAAFLSSPQ